jgi:cystatin-M
MARPHLPLAMGLALLALCLLTLSPDARAEFRGRRTGERKDLSPNDPQVQKAAQMAVANYNMGSNSLYYYRDTHIVKAQSQVR